jgi:hypothetical protein
VTDRERIDRFVSAVGKAFHAPPASVHINRKETDVAFEQKDNTGAVFVNDRKEQDAHPDRTGTARIGGVDYFVNGWLRKSKSGQPYLSLSFKQKNEATSSTGTSRKSDMVDDEIPF